MRAAATLLALIRPCVIDQNLAHRPRRHSKEMCAVLKVWAALVSQAQISLVHQRRRLQRVVRVLSAHMIMSSAVKFLVDPAGSILRAQRGRHDSNSRVTGSPVAGMAREHPSKFNCF